MIECSIFLRGCSFWSELLVLVTFLKLCEISLEVVFGAFAQRRLGWFPHNIRAIMAKIKLPKIPLSMAIFQIKVKRSYRDSSSQADPAGENWTWSYPYFSQKWRFALVENTIRLTIRMLGDFIAGSLRELTYN